MFDIESIRGRPCLIHASAANGCDLILRKEPKCGDVSVGRPIADAHKPYSNWLLLRHKTPSLVSVLVAKAICVPQSKVSYGVRRPPSDLSKVVKDLVGFEIDSIGEIGVAVEDALHVGRFGPGSKNVL